MDKHPKSKGKNTWHWTVTLMLYNQTSIQFLNDAGPNIELGRHQCVFNSYRRWIIPWTAWESSPSLCNHRWAVTIGPAICWKSGFLFAEWSMLESHWFRESLFVMKRCKLVLQFWRATLNAHITHYMQLFVLVFQGICFPGLCFPSEGTTPTGKRTHPLEQYMNMK